jgi:hypothetical protein
MRLKGKKKFYRVERESRRGDERTNTLEGADESTPPCALDRSDDRLAKRGIAGQSLLAILTS